VHRAAFCIAGNEAQAMEIINQLKLAGFANDDISALLPDKTGLKDFGYERHTKAPEGAVAGAGTGGNGYGGAGGAGGAGGSNTANAGSFNMSNAMNGTAVSAAGITTMAENSGAASLVQQGVTVQANLTVSH